MRVITAEWELIKAPEHDQYIVLGRDRDGEGYLILLAPDGKIYRFMKTHARGTIWEGFVR